MTFSKTIYKLDSKSKIRFLTISTEGATLIQESGILGSKKSVVHESTATSKNIGRSNETTPEEQAVLEGESKIESKLSEGYFHTVTEAEENIVILPMLAKDYKKEKQKIVYPCYCQPKLDGMRALGKSYEDMISRKGKEITTMAHIQCEIDDLDMTGKTLYLDGELYAHGKTFQENMRLIKKYREGESEKVFYHVYDLVLDKPFKERMDILFRTVSETNPFIKIVPTYKINNEEEMLEHHTQFLSEGYEGTIIRHSDAGYGINKRDTQLLKYKDFLDIACEIIDIVPATKNPEQGVVHCKSDKGTFGCGMRFSHDERTNMLTNKEDYIGKTAEIRFFEYTDEGLPRFPVMVGFREDV